MSLWTDIRAEQAQRAARVKASTALLPWYAALAGRVNAPASVVVLGDSQEEGSGIGTTFADRAKAYPNQLGNLLRSRYPTPGEAAVQPSNFTPVNTPSALPTGITKGGTWAAGANFGPTANAARSQSAGQTLTFTTPVGCTHVEVIGLGGTSATGWTFSINGGAASATQLVSGTTRDGTTVRIAMPNTNANTVVLTMVGGNNYIGGIIFYHGNADTGVRVFNCGKHGSRANQWAFGGTYNWITSANPTPTTQGGVQSMIGLNPDLLILGPGINDYMAGVTPEAYAAALSSIIAACRAMLPAKTLPVILLGKYTANVSSPAGIPQSVYAAQRLRLAKADPHMVALDLSDRIPAVASAPANLGLYTDTLHATAKGYGLVAAQLAPLVAP